MSSSLGYLKSAQAEIPEPPAVTYWRFLDGRTSRKILRVLVPASLVVIAVALYMALFYAPREATMGDAQRIFYFHVPSAWIGFLSFFIVFCASILYLLKRDRKWDALALSAAEIGVLFTTLVLLTGPLWAKAAWGTYWVWDARLTTTLVLWLVYVGYLMLRGSVDDTKRAPMSAVLGILGFLDVPIIYLSVTWWRTMHPALVVSETGGLEPAMRATLFVALFSFTLLFAWMLLLRVQLEYKRGLLAQRQMEQEV
jgi:heme exporter protein C